MPSNPPKYMLLQFWTGLVMLSLSLSQKTRRHSRRVGMDLNQQSCRRVVLYDTKLELGRWYEFLVLSESRVPVLQMEFQSMKADRRDLY
jgi:hypothetical protein